MNFPRLTADQDTIYYIVAALLVILALPVALGFLGGLNFSQAKAVRYWWPGQLRRPLFPYLLGSLLWIAYPFIAPQPAGSALVAAVFVLGPLIVVASGIKWSRDTDHGHSFVVRSSLRDMDFLVRLSSFFSDRNWQKWNLPVKSRRGAATLFTPRKNAPYPDQTVGCIVERDTDHDSELRLHLVSLDIPLLPPPLGRPADRELSLILDDLPTALDCTVTNVDGPLGSARAHESGKKYSPDQAEILHYHENPAHTAVHYEINGKAVDPSQVPPAILALLRGQMETLPAADLSPEAIAQLRDAGVPSLDNADLPPELLDELKNSPDFRLLGGTSAVRTSRTFLSTKDLPPELREQLLESETLVSFDDLPPDVRERVIEDLRRRDPEIETEGEKKSFKFEKEWKFGFKFGSDK